MRKAAVYAFLIPSLLGFLVFFLIPFVGSFGYAFGNGFETLQKTLSNEAFLLAFKNTLLFMLICVPLNIALPLLLAVAVRRLGKEARLFNLSYIAPLVVPVASVALFWSILFTKNGTASQFLATLGFGQVDILNSGWALVALALVYLWKNIGYMMILYLAGLSEIPNSYSESASLDGAGGVRSFFNITLPCLRPTTFFVLVISVVNCFKVFREIYMIAGPYPDKSIYMLQHYMNNLFFRGDYPMLAMAAIILILLIIAFLIVMFVLNRRAQKKLMG